MVNIRYHHCAYASRASKALKHYYFTSQPPPSDPANLPLPVPLKLREGGEIDKKNAAKNEKVAVAKKELGRSFKSFGFQIGKKYRYIWDTILICKHSIHYIGVARFARSCINHLDMILDLECTLRLVYIKCMYKNRSITSISAKQCTNTVYDLG